MMPCPPTSRTKSSIVEGYHRREHGGSASASASTSASSPSSQTPPSPPDSPPRAEKSPSLRWSKEPEFSLSVYQDLSKARLAALVVLTTMTGYAMAPGATNLATLLWTTVGTGLCVTSANTINQWLEAPFDAQMSRTRTRVLVRHAINPFHAFSFGIVSGIAGTAILVGLVNPITAALGAANIVLYTAVYTPMKRTSIANTWVGAVVGALPPMMGWAACTGTLDGGAWLMGAVLYAWQFPHFNALSWNLRPDYFRYSLALIPLAAMAPYLGMTSWWFFAASNLVNIPLALKAVLPVFLGLMIAFKSAQ
ncbi:UbiA prenyltransferase family-domain-containing protein [Zopfochytrium polystomum]|nr:UbiA prenyltransferase family-domain-containing protein [Zopfochytrium polystomum]